MLPIGTTDSGFLLTGFEGITVAGLFRILTGFPINRAFANQNRVKVKNFLLFDKIIFNLY